METKEIPILLLTGYLGSGKTTLVNRLLNEAQGERFAVIVNDIGEVNIDADLIQKGGVVGMNDDSLVALQNGCICCTLRTDLIEQVRMLLRMQRFDYIVIEASGICEPEPIAQTLCTIPTLGAAYTQYGRSRLDCITCVVDALRLRDEFDTGNRLQQKPTDEEDIANLLIQQIEFSNLVLLNKADEVSAEELGRMREIIHTLQPTADIICCNYADVPMQKLLHTELFDFERLATSAGWIRGIEQPLEELETSHDAHEHEHDHDHHHHHEHEEGETEEYGIQTYVYYRRPAFDIHRLDEFLATRWPRNIIRTKGVCYFSHNRDMSYLFEQAGSQKQLREAGLWYATAPEEDLVQLMKQEPGLLRDWDKTYGDRMQKLVFIGQHLDKDALARELDACLER